VGFTHLSAAARARACGGAEEEGRCVRARLHTGVASAAVARVRSLRCGRRRRSKRMRAAAARRRMAYHERQERQRCLRHALNNLLGGASSGVAADAPRRRR